MEEKEKILEVSSEIRIASIKKIWQISLLVEVYCDQKKILKHLKKVVLVEQKNFSRSRFTKTETAFCEIERFIEETKIVIEALCGANTVDAFNRARKGMEMHIEALEKALNPRKTEIVSGVKHAFKQVKNTVENLKNIAMEKFEKVKKGVCETNEDDSESV